MSKTDSMATPPTQQLPSRLLRKEWKNGMMQFSSKIAKEYYITMLQNLTMASNSIFIPKILEFLRGFGILHLSMKLTVSSSIWIWSCIPCILQNPGLLKI